MMTPATVKERVRRIKEMRDDDEAAHAAEDHLYTEILRAIAYGKIVDAQTCAIEALETQHIGFMRWCA